MLELLQAQHSAPPTTWGSYILPIVLWSATQTVAFIVVLVNNHIKTSTKMKELEVRLSMMERQDSLIMQKLDIISNGIQDLRVDLENKMDRD